MGQITTIPRVVMFQGHPRIQPKTYETKPSIFSFWLWDSLCPYQGQPRMHVFPWAFDVHQSQSPDVAKSWNNLPKVSWAHLSRTRQAGKNSKVACCSSSISLRRLRKDAAGPLGPVLDPEAGQQISISVFIPQYYLLPPWGLWISVNLLGCLKHISLGWACPLLLGFRASSEAWTTKVWVCLQSCWL